MESQTQGATAVLDLLVAGDGLFQHRLVPIGNHGHHEEAPFVDAVDIPPVSTDFAEAQEPARQQSHW
jgi:hypothetical protein